jgi:hypothetical protein
MQHSAHKLAGGGHVVGCFLNGFPHLFSQPGAPAQTHPAYKKKSNSNLGEEVVGLLLLCCSVAN